MGMAGVAGRLRGSRIVVTGASEGIGRALARLLAAHGARLVLAARDPARLESIVAECHAAGAEAHAVPTDVSDPQACRALVAAATAALGGLDVLVNNAGATMWARVDAVSDLGIFERLMRVNYLGAIWLTHAALPQLKASRGQVVAIASLAGLTGVPERSGYAGSKHAMVGFFESLRIELEPDGVAVTIVAPDFVLTETHRRAAGADGQPLGESPMQEGRIMSAEDCARLVQRAIQGRERLLIGSLRGRFGYRLKPFVPRWLDSIAARAIRRGR